MNTLVELSKVSFKDTKTDRLVLNDITLNIKKAEILTIIGPNGAGKTTLIKLILGLISPTTGTIKKNTLLKIGYMPQKIGINIFLPLNVNRLLQLSKKEHIEENVIDEALEKVQILSLKHQSVHSLSGGEWQRVLLARALLRGPDLLVLDEPAQGVDVIGQSEFYLLLSKLRNDLKCGIVLVSHDLHHVMAATNQVICLNQHICCSGAPDTIIHDPEYHLMFSKTKEIPLTLGVTSYTHHHNHRHDCVVSHD
ncbi:MAG: metal ABC transporter ATP-binding protein [Alphaproteobacteria bacterium]|nr:metal ABC transporter ATP-binding protein [Alphaproteobacteria bacterium]